MTPRAKNATPPPVVRCAIYTRKSTEEGLDKEFNSLDAQREAAEAYIRSQQHAGWRGLPEHYDDGGFTGGNVERPALQRLLADCAAHKLDCVVVYKVDRFSRSLLDFAKMMEVLERHQVAFVSVTQQFNTASSMGRLVLNILLSFAQFEREIIAERTRDKIAAARRKGKWAGGMPLLGYDVDPRGSKLIVNQAEAKRVRAILALFLEHQALLPLVQELAQRGWVNKRWLTRKGHPRGGKPFTLGSLRRLLGNVTYYGQVRYRTEVHPGEHQGVVDKPLWESVQALLKRQYPPSGRRVLNPYGALLRGRLYCAPCGCAMTPSHSTKGSKRYRYYICTGALKRGRQTCPAPSLSAGTIEQLVVEQILKRGPDAPWGPLAALWPALPAPERVRVLQLVVERVTVDRAQGRMTITFDPAGIETLAQDLAQRAKEKKT